MIGALSCRHDSSAPSVGKVYHGWFEVGESIDSSAEVPYAQAAKDKYDERWIYAHCAFFAAAYVLDPEFVNHEQSSIEEVMTGFGEVLGNHSWATRNTFVIVTAIAIVTAVVIVMLSVTCIKHANPFKGF